MQSFQDDTHVNFNNTFLWNCTEVEGLVSLLLHSEVYAI